MIETVINNLKAFKGLDVIDLLNSNDREFIKKLENKNNVGVLESLNRDYVLLLSHDFSFRNPLGNLVLNSKQGFYFPALPFPEVDGQNVVSGSPNLNVHKHFEKKFNILDEKATLIVGFNL